jgi:hypothetical protein
MHQLTTSWAMQGALGFVEFELWGDISTAAKIRGTYPKKNNMVVVAWHCGKVGGSSDGSGGGSGGGGRGGGCGG